MSRKKGYFPLLIMAQYAFPYVHLAEFSHATGLPASYRSETVEEARESRMRYNPSEWELEAWVSTYVAIATGEMSIVSHTVEALTGHAPQSFTDYLRRHPESYAHVRAI